jgi:hypothetical protein
VERKSFLAASTMVAALATDACAKSSSQLEMIEPKADFNYAQFVTLVNRPFAVRQLWDVNGYIPTALGGIKNAYNGYQFGYAIAPDAIGMIACLHGTANAFAYNDALWSKYKLGEAFSFKDPAGNLVTSNIFYHARSQPGTTADPNDPASMYQDGTLETLQRRGLIVMVCHTAAAEQARSLIGAGVVSSGASAEDVLRELLANVVPGATIVPSMVATVGLLQSRFHYAYTSPAGA